MDILSLVKELADKDEQEHGIIMFEDIYLEFYKLCLDESKILNAYIRNRVFDNDGRCIKGTKAVHFIGEYYKEGMQRFCDVRTRFSIKARQKALILGYPVIGIDSSMFYTGMDYNNVDSIIEEYYSGLAASTSFYEVEKCRNEDKRKSREAVRKLYSTEHVSYDVRRKLSDFPFMFECCNSSDDIAHFIENAEIEIEVYYEQISFDSAILNFIETVCKKAYEIWHNNKCENSIEAVCSQLDSQRASDERLYKQALCMIYFRSMIDSDSDGAEFTKKAVTGCFGSSEKLAAVTSIYLTTRRTFRDNAEWENYSIRVNYERYIRTHNIKVKGALNIKGYNEPIVEVSYNNDRLIDYLWKRSCLLPERLIYKPYENGKIICYADGVADKDKVLKFKDLLSESIRVAANWFRLQGYDPLFCRNGMGCGMYYRYGLYFGMPSTECEKSIAEYLGQQNNDANTDVRKYKKKIRRILSGYRYNHEQYEDVEIMHVSKAPDLDHIKSLDKNSILEAFAEQYYLPELLRQADNIGRPLLDLLNECVLRYLLDSQEPVVTGLGKRLSKVFKISKNNTLDNETEDEHHVPFCYVNKTTNVSMVICLLFNYNRIGSVDIIFPVPVVFDHSDKNDIKIITDYEKYFSGNNSVLNYKEVTYNHFIRNAEWLSEYVLV